MNLTIFGSSLLSSYWNGAATYYRGLFGAMARRGHGITFLEPDAYERQSHRDIEPPSWARSVVWRPDAAGLDAALDHARTGDVVVKCSGVGVHDDALLAGILARTGPAQLRVLLDVDAPATLAGYDADPLSPGAQAVPALDLVLTYGGGEPVVASYEAHGARRCVPIYNALDPATHHPASPETRFRCDLALLANRLPDREQRIEHFFLEPAASLPKRRFVLGGAGWHERDVPANVERIGHVPTADHNALNCSALAVLNVARDSMATVGFSPATRVFEAAGAGACLVTDWWAGIEVFLEPDREILVARDGRDVADHLAGLSAERARRIGERARARILAEHTYDRRAELLEDVLDDALARRRAEAA